MCGQPEIDVAVARTPVACTKDSTHLAWLKLCHRKSAANSFGN